MFHMLIQTIREFLFGKTFPAILGDTHHERLRYMIDDARLLLFNNARSPNRIEIDAIDNMQDEIAMLESLLNAEVSSSKIHDSEKQFLVAYDLLCSRFAPVTAQSIKYSQQTHGRLLFPSTIMLTIFSVLIAGLAIYSQWRWVHFKLDHTRVVQTIDLKKQLNEKRNDKSDAIDMADRALSLLPDDFGPLIEENPEKPKKVPLKILSADEIKLKLQREALQQELASLKNSMLPIDRQLNALKADELTFLRKLQEDDASTFIFKYLSAMANTQQVQKYYEKLKLEAEKESLAAIESLKSTSSCSNSADSRYYRSFCNSRIESLNSRKASRLLLLANAELIEYIHKAEATLNLMQAYWIPSLMGLLGALIFTLRDTSKKLENYTYVPRGVARTFVRIALGAIAGAIGGWFVPNSETIFKTIPPIIVPFLFGYSVETLFALVDRAISAFSPSDKVEPKRSFA